MRGWEGQPRKMVEYEHWQKIKPKCRSSGCGLEFGGAENDLLAIRLPSRPRPPGLAPDCLMRRIKWSSALCILLFTGCVFGL
jgi:hypothetical protein